MAKANLRARATLDNRPFQTGLSAMKDGVSNIKNQLAGLAAGASLAALANEAIALAGTVTDLSARYGVSTDIIQRHGFVAAQDGASMEGLAASYGKLKRAQADVLAGSTSSIAAFEALGISGNEAASIPVDELFLRISDTVATAGEDVRVFDAVIATMGKSAADLIPTLSRGREGIQAMAAAAPTMGEETISALDDAGDKIEEVRQVMVTATGTLMSWLTPVAKFVDELLQRVMVMGGLLYDIAANLAATPLQPGAAFEQAIAQARGTIEELNKMKAEKEEGAAKAKAAKRGGDLSDSEAGPTKEQTKAKEKEEKQIDRAQDDRQRAEEALIEATETLEEKRKRMDAALAKEQAAMEKLTASAKSRAAEEARALQLKERLATLEKPEDAVNPERDARRQQLQTELIQASPDVELDFRSLPDVERGGTGATAPPATEKNTAAREEAEKRVLAIRKELADLDAADQADRAAERSRVSAQLAAANKRLEGLGGEDSTARLDAETRILELRREMAQLAKEEAAQAEHKAKEAAQARAGRAQAEFERLPTQAKIPLLQAQEEALSQQEATTTDPTERDQLATKRLGLQSRRESLESGLQEKNRFTLDSLRQVGGGATKSLPSIGGANPNNPAKDSVKLQTEMVSLLKKLVEKDKAGGELPIAGFGA